MNMQTSLRDHFLIAMPNLRDPNFEQSVTYICEHSAEGAMGIVLNAPMAVSLGDVLNSLDIHCTHPEVCQRPVLAGGPVQTDRGFVIHSNDKTHWKSSLSLNSEISITTSSDILAALADNKGPTYSTVALGYAGWEPGQLEQELTENAWLCGPADLDIIFNCPVDERWRAATALMGVHLEHLSLDMGHA